MYFFLGSLYTSVEKELLTLDIEIKTKKKEISAQIRKQMKNKYIRLAFTLRVLISIQGSRKKLDLPRNA